MRLSRYSYFMCWKSYLLILIIAYSGLHLKTCAPTWQQSWVVAFMDTVHRKHGSPLRQLVWIAGTCLVEFPTKSRGYGVWVVGVTKYAVFRFPPIQGYPTVGVAKYADCRIKCFAPRRG